MPIAPWKTLLAASLLSACHASEPRQETGPAPDGKKRLTLEQTLGQGEKVDFTGELPRYSWAPDGVHLVLEEKERKVWIDPATWKESAPAAEPEKEDDGVTTALLAAGVPKEAAEKRSPRATARAANGGTLVAIAGELWWVQDGAARRLADAAGGEIELQELSPDGARVAFVQANDLVVVDTASGASSRRTARPTC